MTVQTFVFIRNKFISCQEFNSKYKWAKLPTEDEQDQRQLPEKCVSIYYSVNIEQQTIEKLYMVSYAPQYQPSFKKISVAWVDEYFAVEPADLLQLDHPEENIIQPGGEIFCLINEDEQVVGTVAMIIDQEEGAVELAKMGVAKEFCGKGYAHPLMKEALMWAQKKSFSVINLHTASKLTVAISLYEKYGFKAIPFQAHGRFARVDLFMRLTF